MNQHKFTDGVLYGRQVKVCEQCARYAFKADSAEANDCASIIHERWCDVIEGLRSDISNVAYNASRSDWNR